MTHFSRPTKLNGTAFSDAELDAAGRTLLPHLHTRRGSPTATLLELAAIGNATVLDAARAGLASLGYSIPARHNTRGLRAVARMAAICDAIVPPHATRR